MNETYYKETCLHVWSHIGSSTVKGKQHKTFQCDRCKDQYIATAVESDPAFDKLFTTEKKP